MRNVMFSAFLLCFALMSAGQTHAQPLVLGDQIIRTDTVWSGEIIVDGVVVVGREATLTIKPGTRIRFRKKDLNNDQIGDSEIRVLGRLIARGTPEEIITFASAEPVPTSKDWSYVMIFTSGQENFIQYCSFQHAFTGLQVHFSVARIADSTFTDNFEGLRFGRGELTIEHNRFSHNDVGIRFTRMEGPATIRQNEITDNRLGIFLVPSGQNIMDFFEPDRSGRAWNTGHLMITANNIFNNSWYDLDLGEKQFWNLEAAGNWWGTTDHNQISAKMFAHQRDPALGKVLYQPTATAKITEAGPRMR
ncbi:MAG: right-handed parallel beta-helix repeat-containing protein [Proteobacteria bacterium]|nr:right-handed parallel beta-helix repeat-containing protein [Pseudomonadota bacterium]MBU1714046.1 right-handed parallel beta-helix repeat-containing protein [Pseudomonadota bacterium]